MWVPFLEKAWAKLNGNYDRIISGNEMEGFYLLTGFPSQNYNLNSSFALNATAIFNFVRDADQKQFAMSISTPGTNPNPCALTPGHAYTLLGATTFLNADGTKAFDVYSVRNPWGTDSTYNCSFNDKDPRWTQNPAWATQVKWVNNSVDGYFYITKEDAIRGFANIVVNFVQDSLTPSSVRFTGDANVRARFVTFKIT